MPYSTNIHDFFSSVKDNIYIRHDFLKLSYFFQNQIEYYYNLSWNIKSVQILDKF